MFTSRGYASLCYIILTKGPWKRLDIHPSGASHQMVLYLGFPICKIKRMILSFLCKMPERCRKVEGATLLECQHGCPGTQVTAVVHGKWRKIWFQLIAFSACAGSDSPGRAITAPVSLAEEGNGGAEPALWLTADRNAELRRTSGFMQIFRAVVNYPRTFQLQTDLELMLFVLFLA